jgi:hypothetical protein
MTQLALAGDTSHPATAERDATGPGPVALTCERDASATTGAEVPR